jgi:hypothetical protein
MNIRRSGHIAFVLLAQAVLLLAGFNAPREVSAIVGDTKTDRGNVGTLSVPVSVPVGLPQGDTTLGIAAQVAFVHSGTLGLIPAQSPDGSSTLFSFSMSSGQIFGSSDLTADFGVGSSSGSAIQNPLEYLQAFDSSGLVAAYGQDSSGSQKVVMFECDQAGGLSRLWAQSFPSPPGSSTTPSVQFNSDGSRLYTYYTVSADASDTAAAEVVSRPEGGLTGGSGRSLPPLIWETEARPAWLTESQETINSYLVLINSVDGSVGDTFQIPTTPIDSGPVHGLVFDVQSDRLIAMVGASIYVFQDLPKQVSLITKISPTADAGGAASPIGVVGGRFLASFAGLEFKPSGDYFFCTDLDHGTTTSLFIAGDIAPFGNLMSIDQSSNSILVPYSLIITIHGDDIDIVIGTRKFDTLSISGNGIIARSSRTVLPPSHASATNAFKNGDNATPSKSGAMCFLAVWSGSMFTIDTETGAVVNQTNLAPSPLKYLTLDTATDQMVFNAGSTLEIMDVPDRPIISGVAVKGKQTTISGANFLSGATVTISGINTALVNSSQPVPGREIIVGLGKADFPKGRQFNLVVTNRDGLSSGSFSFER